MKKYVKVLLVIVLLVLVIGGAGFGYKYLSEKYNGLYIDIDSASTNSSRAKIEAFLRLK